MGKTVKLKKRRAMRAKKCALKNAVPHPNSTSPKLPPPPKGGKNTLG